MGPFPQVDSSDSATHFLRAGLALRGHCSREHEAIAAFRRALALDPGLAEAHHQLGNALKRKGHFHDAVKCLVEASRLAPTEPVIWLNRGVAHLELKQLCLAIECFERAVALAPDLPEAHNVLGSTLLEAGSVTDAERVLRHAVALRPDYAAAHDNLGRVLRAQGRAGEAIEEYRAALNAKPDPGTHSNLCYAMNFVPGLAREAVLREHRAWADAHGGRREPSSPGASPAVLRPQGDPANRPLRVGFVSPDLANHAVAYFLEPLLRQPRSGWELVCYSDVAVPDAVTSRLRSMAPLWRNCAALDDSQLEALIRRDRVDVLIDLAGHTARNRLQVFARKPAPVQATWLGYPNTTGIPEITFRITDRLTDPVGETEPWHTETLWRMPRAFLCYALPSECPEPAAPPVRSSGYVTFGSFSNLAKISSPCIALWAQVLRRVPASRLRLKSRGLADQGLAADVRRRFNVHGVDGERIQLDGNLVSTGDHLRQYASVDIALDPFPYNGTTTTCEALAMGVPVVTLRGSTHVARVGTSLLTHLGRPEWIASTPERYVELCVELAGNATHQDRQGLREQFVRSPVCDASGFAQEFGRAIEGMWEQATRLQPRA